MFKVISLVGGTIGFVAACNACPLLPLILGVCTVGAGAVALKN